MKKTILSSLAATAIFLNFAFGQTQNLNHSISFKYEVISGDMLNNYSVVKNQSLPYCSSVLVEADVIKITDLLSLGFFAGGQLAQQGEYSETGALYYVSSYAGRCGVESYLNVLRCLGHTTDVWDVSLKATLGVFWTPNLTPQAEYGLGFDATVYPFKHVGFSLGCDWGRYAVSNRTFYNVVEGNFKMNLGLRFRF